MIDVTVTCRSCGIEHEPDRAAFTRGTWRTCPSCRQAIHDHAAREMQRLGYALPHPDRPHHAAVLAALDARWNDQLANAARFLVRVHALDRAGEEREP